MMIKTTMHSKQDAYRPQWPSRGGVGCVCPSVCVCAGGVSAWGVVHSTVNRITDRCQNITFPQLLLWTVKINCWLYFQLPSDTGCSAGESLLFLLVVSPLSLKCQRNT